MGKTIKLTYDLLKHLLAYHLLELGALGFALVKRMGWIAELEERAS